MKFDVAVVDYGIGNLFSVQRALEHCGAKVLLTADAERIKAAPRVLLPGVGAFADGMAELRRYGLDATIRDVASLGTPLLGICLGMQLLLDESEEFGITAGLGLIPGRVVAIPASTVSGEAQKIPHIGWNELLQSPSRNDWQETPLADLGVGAAMYFVHSFMAQPADMSHRIADCLYGGHRVSAVIGRDNVFGCQFHPEKSGELGLTVLRRFLA